MPSNAVAPIVRNGPIDRRPRMSDRIYNIAVIPGDGIGREVMP